MLLAFLECLVYNQCSACVIANYISAIRVFAFLRLSNIVPHFLGSFDPSRHLTGKDVFFSKKFVKILLKWSKTMQTRDKVVFLALPRLSDHLICPFGALKSLFKAYPMSSGTFSFRLLLPRVQILLLAQMLGKFLKI